MSAPRRRYTDSDTMQAPTVEPVDPRVQDTDTAGVEQAADVVGRRMGDLEGRVNELWNQVQELRRRLGIAS
jgi:hypothetical protein